MSNLPPNPYNNAQAASLANANQTAINPSQFGQLPPSQLPPGFVGTKQDANSNSPHHFMSVQNHSLQNINQYNQSTNSSPAFNQSGLLPSSLTSQASPIKPPLGPAKSSIPSNVSSASGSPSPFNANPSPTPYQTIQQHQINDNAPPLVSSSQYNQPMVNGPSTSVYQYQGRPTDQFPVTTSTPVKSQNVPLTQAFGPPVSKSAGAMSSQAIAPISNHMGARNSPLMQGPVINDPAGQMSLNGPYVPPVSSLGPPKSLAGGLPQASKAGPYINGPTMSGPPNRPMMAQPMKGSSISGQPISLPPSIGQSVNRQPMAGPQTIGPPMSGPQSSGLPVAGPITSGPNLSGPQSSGPPMLGLKTTGPYPSGPQSSRHPMSGPLMTSGPNLSGPQTTGPPISGPTRTGPAMSGMPMTGPTMGPLSGNLVSGPINGPLMSEPMRQAYPGLPRNGPPGSMGPPGPQSLPPQFPPGSQSLPTQYPPQPPMNQINPLGSSQGLPSGPQASLSGPQGLPSGHQGLQSGPQGLPSGPQGLPSGSSQQPQNGPKTNMQNRYPQMPPQPMGQYPQQYTTQNMTQQMGNLSITKQGFDQLWGHQTVDLMSCKHILPEYPEEVPEVKLGPGFPDAVNCSPEIFRCTINRIPETNSLLQKSRLPLGILIHPFKDLNHLPVIQCNTIVRCRSCRTYINPFVYFVDAKRWKCNLCFRVNDLPEEFLFDPVSKSYGDPSRRPEIKSATIEFIAPGEYMLRPPQPAVYLFLMDVSQIARESGYLQVVCDTIKACLDELPGDARTQIGFICYDSHVHYYLMSEGLSRPKEMTVLDIEDIFLPSPESLLANLGERRELINELLTVLPQRYSVPGVPTSALGAALQAAYKLMAPTGGRVTVFQTCLPNVGPGALQPREDPNARSSKDVAHLNPSTDFYKRLALDCSGAQVAVDLFLLNSQYSDLATLSGMSKFSGGSVSHIPLYKSSRGWQADLLHRMLSRYLTRKIGFEAVMRVRATRGVTIHTFHGNFFVRSTDLLSLPNVSPDAAFGMQLSIEESLTDLQHVCFQAALLYTSSKGERRIRVHTMSLPVANTLPDVLHAADTQCIIGLLSKMAVDRAQSASLSEAREALMHVAVETLSAHRLASNLPAASAGPALHAPHSLRLIPLYLLALLKRKAFRTGTSTRLDDRVADMCELKSAPLFHLLRGVYPSLYPIHSLCDHTTRDEDDELVVDPPRLQLTAERVNSNGCYLLDDGDSMIIYVGRNASPAFLSETFAVTAFSQIQDEARSVPRVDSQASAALHAFIERLNDDRPYASSVLVLRDNSPSRQLFTDRLVDDRVESAFSYYEFLQHVKTQVK